MHEENSTEENFLDATELDYRTVTMLSQKLA